MFSLFPIRIFVVRRAGDRNELARNSNAAFSKTIHPVQCTWRFCVGKRHKVLVLRFPFAFGAYGAFVSPHARSLAVHGRARVRHGSATSAVFVVFDSADPVQDVRKPTHLGAFERQSNVSPSTGFPIGTDTRTTGRIRAESGAELNTGTPTPCDHLSRVIHVSAFIWRFKTSNSYQN